MKFRASILGCFLATAAFPVMAQSNQVMTMPTAASNAAPVNSPPPESGDTPEDIAKDAARDLKDSRYYNKAGATRAQFNADWQECRLIARGTRTPAGSYTYVYNPAFVSPLAAGIGGGIGAAIGQAIIEGQLRRANRRTCLLIRGWRLVDPAQAETTRLAALGDAERDAYLSSIIGATRVEGQITERSNFEIALDPSVNLNAPLTLPGEVWTGRKVDPATSIALKSDEALVAIAFRRTVPESSGRSALLQLARYDMDKRDLIYQPRDWKKRGDATVYAVTAASANRKAEYEVQLHRVTAGSYVVLGTGLLGAVATNSYCFGAPAFRVEAGQTIYVGDLVPLVNARRADGDRLTTLAYTRNLENARTVLATKQPDVAKAMIAAPLFNRATYGCAAVAMDRWDWPGLEPLPTPVTTAAR